MALRIETTHTKDDVLAHGVGSGADSLRRFRCTGAHMHADLAEIMIEARFEEFPRA